MQLLTDFYEQCYRGRNGMDKTRIMDQPEYEHMKTSTVVIFLCVLCALVVKKISGTRIRSFEKSLKGTDSQPLFINIMRPRSSGFSRRYFICGLQPHGAGFGKNLRDAHT